MMRLVLQSELPKSFILYFEFSNLCHFMLKIPIQLNFKGTIKYLFSKLFSSLRPLLMKKVPTEKTRKLTLLLRWVYFYYFFV